MMTVETAKDSLCINQTITQKSESFIIESDVIVPDIKPDILNTVSTSGTVCIYKKEISNGRVKVEGKIDTYIMYLADTEDGYIRSLNTNIEFSQSFNISEAQEKMMLNLDLGIKSIDCKVLNGRKISIKALLDANIMISTNENLNFIKQVDNVKDIQVLNKNFMINSLVGSGETRTYAKDTIKINIEDNLAEVMKCNFHIMNKDVKISYNKVLIKSDLEVKILYLTDDNRVCTTETIIPVMGFIDMQGISEENLCDVRYEICNIVIDPKNVEEHSIYVEVEVKIYCETYENKELNIIQDLYSPSVDLCFTKKEIQAMQARQSIQDTCSIRDKQVISEMQGGKIYDVEVVPIITNQNILKDKVIYDGEVNLKFVYSTNNASGIDTKNISLPYNFTMQCPNLTVETEINTGIEVGLQNFIVTSDETIDIKIDLIFKVSMSNNARINVIDEITIDEDSKMEKYSMVIYFVKPGDSLWKIAKKFGSTVQAIAEVNNIEQIDNISVGQQLFIPRYNG